MVKCIHLTGHSVNVVPDMHRGFLSTGSAKHGNPLCNQLSGARQSVLSTQTGKSSDRQQSTTEACRPCQKQHVVLQSAQCQQLWALTDSVFHMFRTSEYAAAALDPKEVQQGQEAIQAAPQAPMVLQPHQREAGFLRPGAGVTFM